MGAREPLVENLRGLRGWGNTLPRGSGIHTNKVRLWSRYPKASSQGKARQKSVVGRGGGVGARTVVCVRVCLCDMCVCVHNIHRSNVLVCLFGQCTLAPRRVPDLSVYSVSIHW